MFSIVSEIFVTLLKIFKKRRRTSSSTEKKAKENQVEKSRQSRKLFLSLSRKIGTKVSSPMGSKASKGKARKASTVMNEKGKSEKVQEGEGPGSESEKEEEIILQMGKMNLELAPRDHTMRAFLEPEEKERILEQLLEDARPRDRDPSLQKAGRQ